MKHAFCIIAHNEVYTLNKLLECLDHPSCDIFIFIDKKRYDITKNIISPVRGNLFILPKINTINVFWGDISLVDAELRILEYAQKHADYDYFHLLSGVDLPIKSVEYINEFFNKLGPDKNLIGFVTDELLKESIETKCNYYMPFIKYIRKIGMKGYIFCKLQHLILSFQEKLKLKRNFDFELKKGCEWASLSSKFVKYLINNRYYILSKFKGILGADEFYKQTIAWNNGFRDTIYSTEEEALGCLREIDWERGSPYTYSIDDLNMLMQSKKLFARKFNSQVDKEIIDAITNQVKISRL